MFSNKNRMFIIKGGGVIDKLSVDQQNVGPLGGKGGELREGLWTRVFLSESVGIVHG